MGNKYEVNIWVLNQVTKTNEYNYSQVYAGDWLFPAIYVMIFHKIRGVKCVKLEWR